MRMEEITENEKVQTKSKRPKNYPKTLQRYVGKSKGTSERDGDQVYRMVTEGVKKPYQGRGTKTESDIADGQVQ